MPNCTRCNRFINTTAIVELCSTCEGGLPNRVAERLPAANPITRAFVLREACLAYARTTLGHERAVAEQLAASAEDLTGEISLEDEPTLSADAERRMGC